jgi:putative peptidoglycan lipid II flippase
MFFSMKDTRTPVYVAAAAMAVNLGLCYALAFPLGSGFRLRLGGVALAGSVASYVNFLLLLVILERRVGRLVDRALVVSVLKGTLASALMAVPLWYSVKLFGERMARSKLDNAAITLLLLFAGVVLFILFSLLLRNGDIGGVKDLVLKRLKGKSVT